MIKLLKAREGITTQWYLHIRIGRQYLVLSRHGLSLTYGNQIDASVALVIYAALSVALIGVLL